MVRWGMQNAPSALGADGAWGFTLPLGGGRLCRSTISRHSCTDALTLPRVSKTLGVSRVELRIGVQNHELKGKLVIGYWNWLLDVKPSGCFSFENSVPRVFNS